MIVNTLTLINAEYLKEYSPIPLNFNLDDIWSYVPMSEKLHIVPIIGSKLYNKLLKEVDDNNIPEEDSTLLLNIYQVEAYCIVYEALNMIAYNISEQGIVKHKSENAETVNIEELKDIKNNLNTQIVFLKNNLIQFLNNNKDCYPDFKGVSTVKNNENNLRLYNSNVKNI